MRLRLRMGDKEKAFIRRVNERSGHNVTSCYQCGRCTAGCPFAFEMDVAPNQIIRMVQMGMEDELMASKAIYTCASCFTCHARCPKGIDIARIAEAVRELSDPKGPDRFGPDQIPPDLADELPQQVMVAVVRKFAK